MTGWRERRHLADEFKEWLDQVSAALAGQIERAEIREAEAD